MEDSKDNDLIESLTNELEAAAAKHRAGEMTTNELKAILKDVVRRCNDHIIANNINHNLLNLDRYKNLIEIESHCLN